MNHHEEARHIYKILLLKIGNIKRHKKYFLTEVFSKTRTRTKENSSNTKN